MSTAPREDVDAFVAARWPDLEAVALAATLDPDTARRVTTHALAGLVHDWDAATETGAPTVRARGELLDSLDTGPTHGRHAERPVLPDPALRVAAVDPRSAVPAALFDALADERPLVRAALVAPVLWGVHPDEVLALTGRHADEVADALAGARVRLTAAHGAARARDGLAPAPEWFEGDLATLVRRLSAQLPPPPTAGELAAGAAPRTGRRVLLVVGGLAVVAGATAWLLRGRVTPTTTGPSTELPLPSDDAAWQSTRQWPARGALATDDGVRELIARSPGWTVRLLYADDVHGIRLVVGALTDEGVGSMTVLRVWTGAAGSPANGLTEVPLDPAGIDAPDVAAVVVPGPTDPVLLVLTAPEQAGARFSSHVRPTSDGVVEREWVTIPLVDGVGTAVPQARPGLAARLRCSRLDGLVARPAAWTEEVLASGADERVARIVADSTGLPRESLTTTVVRSRLGDTAAELIDSAPGTATAWLTTVRTPAGAVIRELTVGGTSGTDGDFRWSLLPVVVPASEATSPALLQIARTGGTATFVVTAPEGSATVRLHVWGSSGAQESPVTPVVDGAAVVVVPDPPTPPESYRVVATDTDGRVLYDDEIPTGQLLLGALYGWV